MAVHRPQQVPAGADRGGAARAGGASVVSRGDDPARPGGHPRGQSRRGGGGGRRDRRDRRQPAPHDGRHLRLTSAGAAAGDPRGAPRVPVAAAHNRSPESAGLMPARGGSLVASEGVRPAPNGAACADAAVRLHRSLLHRHWRGSRLIGPDCGVRVNYRAGRFVKSYLRRLPWRDDLYYLQGQAYWILANWRLHDLTGEAVPADVAADCARAVVTSQRPDGAWNYPNREWRGRVANAEGSWAAIALIETHRRTGERSPLEAALRWHRQLVDEVGFQPALGGLSANYFAGERGGAPVPNTSAYVVRLLAELADVSGDDGYLAPAPGLLRFLRAAQRPDGELP